MGPQTSPDQNSCFGHNNNDEVDEDIANVPLDYGQSESTKALMRRIEFRWHMYSQVRSDEPGVLPMWNNAEEAVRQLNLNDAHRFLKFCLKLWAQ
ncbi:hypothetical protein N7476_000309 [Penicillium atrosanguineum]|uniref:Uncharacterized protein n=1 Tax=Penicillium atrosanguineum TaxID=1132637 RepID=A0A9W9QBB9_9EURO|nr:hypothetical protein N7476_000309 [Penicillium atrosanguineum]